MKLNQEDIDILYELEKAIVSLPIFYRLTAQGEEIFKEGARVLKKLREATE